MLAFYSTLAVFVGLVRLTCALPSPEGASTSPPACFPVCLTPDEALVLQIVNDERRILGLSPLELDPMLVAVARDHSLDMAQRGYFDHLAPAPAPTTPLDRYAAALGRPPEGVVGENIGRATQPLMGVIHNQMMQSPEHKANITDVEYVRVGVGVCETADGRVWVTEMFLGTAPPNALTSGGEPARQ